VDSKQRSQILTGAVLIAVGLLFFAGQLDPEWRSALRLGRLWPVMLLVLGVGRLVLPDDEKGEKRSSGGWLLFIGSLFLLHNYHVLRLSQSWPLFVVAAGLSIMFSRPKPVRAAAPSGPPASTPSPGIFDKGEQS
jgi:hypothetical protein